MQTASFQSNPSSKVTAAVLRRQAQAPAQSQLSMVWVDTQSSCRAATEQMIQHGFYQAYHASLCDFMPLLVSLGIGRPQAVLGLRSGHSPLFLEQYLSDPLAETLSHHGIRCSAGQIAEMGHLCSKSSRLTLPLLVSSCLMLVRCHYQYVIFTATPKIHQLLRGHGLTLLPLGKAMPSALPDGGQQWGSYYQSNPEVFLLSLNDVLRQLEHYPQLLSAFEQFSLDIPDALAKIRSL